MKTKKVRFKEHRFNIKSETPVSDIEFQKILIKFIEDNFNDFDDIMKKIDIKSDIQKDDSIDVIIYIEHYDKIPIINKKLINEYFKPYSLTSKVVKKYKKNNIFKK